MLWCVLYIRVDSSVCKRFFNERMHVLSLRRGVSAALLWQQERTAVAAKMQKESRVTVSTCRYIHALVWMRNLDCFQTHKLKEIPTHRDMYHVHEGMHGRTNLLAAFDYIRRAKIVINIFKLLC